MGGRPWPADTADGLARGHSQDQRLQQQQQDKAEQGDDRRRQQQRVQLQPELSTCVQTC